MAEVKCPTCDAVLPEKELVNGWCESCGKRIPDFVRAQSGSVQRAPPGQPARRSDGGEPAPKGGSFFDGARMLLVLVGVGLIIYGVMEWRVAQGTTTEPSDVDLAALEQGKPLPQNHVR